MMSWAAESVNFWVIAVPPITWSVSSEWHGNVKLTYNSEETSISDTSFTFHYFPKCGKSELWALYILEDWTFTDKKGVISACLSYRTYFIQPIIAELCAEFFFDPTLMWHFYYTVFIMPTVISALYKQMYYELVWLGEVQILHLCDIFQVKVCLMYLGKSKYCLWFLGI